MKEVVETRSKNKYIYIHYQQGSADSLHLPTKKKKTTLQN